MEGKQGIHIFLGAPIFPKEKGTPGAGTPVEETSENWNSIELYCREGKLHPASELREGGAIAGDARICWSKRAAGYVCNHSDRLSVNQTRPSSEPSRQNESCSPSETGKEAARQGTEGTGALRSQTVSGRKRLVNRSQELPGDAITEYLDSCFPEGADPGTAEQELSPQTEFLSVWAASQAAILKGLLASECGESPEVQKEETVSGPAPELHTPMRVQNSTPGVIPGAPQPGRAPPEEPHTAEGSEELFSAPGELLPRGEGGVVMEMCSTALLCSQEEPPHQDGDPTENRRETEEGASKPTAPSPPATAPESKKTRTSLSNRKVRRGLRETMGLPGKPALLRSCVDQAQRYKVLACVLNPCHLKEVRVRSGTSAGSAVPLATIVVTDQSGTERKVVLWRAAAFWALTVYPGDLVVITDVSVKEDQWRGETVLQSTPASKHSTWANSSTSTMSEVRWKSDPCIRPAVMTVTDGDSVISVEVPPVLVEQIFLNIPAEQLNKPAVPSSQLSFSQVVSEMCLSLLSHPADTFLLTLRSSFLLDENSIPLRQHFLLLDFHPEL
ncbi:Protein FAM35A [Acipenser ruthenus]|uniref:Protein FAM35A n=1 Tax=Acipenser ruthenus TaxID=7906 RepID=A0A444U3L6_ACIRT|nr:Protein FAM35A [Acipenser ruthenus]